MIPIVEYPEVVAKHLPRFQKCFKRVEQFQHFAQYVTGLIVCIKHNIKHMNDQFLWHCDQSTKNRFLTEAPWSELKVNHRRIKLIKDRIKNVSPRKCMLIIDDTLLEHDVDTKSMKQMSLFRDPGTGLYEHGHVIVTTHLDCPLGQFPINFRLYYPKGCVSKITLAKWLVKSAIRMGLPFQTVAFDAWYLAPELTDYLDAQGKAWVSRGKSNRVAFLEGHKQPIVQWLSRQNTESIMTIIVDGESYQTISKTIKLSNHKRVKLVAIKDPKDETGWTLLLCNQLHWSPDGIIRAYKRRWKIETFYRDAKQNLGLEDYMLRSMIGTKRHWYLVFLAYTLLELSSLDSGLMQAFKTNAVSVGNRCREAMQDVGRLFILWVIRQSALGKDLCQIFDLAYVHQKFQRAAQTL